MVRTARSFVGNRLPKKHNIIVKVPTKFHRYILQNRICANLRNVDVSKYSNQQENELDDNHQGVNRGHSKRSLSSG
jgi:hypothetical protein